MSPFSKAALEKYKGFYLADRGKIPVKVSMTESTHMRHSTSIIIVVPFRLIATEGFPYEW